jgi:hypothetical protein
MSGYWVAVGYHSSTLLRLVSREDVGMTQLILWFGGRGCDALDSFGLDRIARDFHCYSERGDGVYYFGLGIMMMLAVVIFVLVVTLFLTTKTTP